MEREPRAPQGRGWYTQGPIADSPGAGSAGTGRETGIDVGWGLPERRGGRAATLPPRCSSGDARG